MKGRVAPGGARRLPLHRARRLSLGRDRATHRAAARRAGRRRAGPAADHRGRAAGRRRVSPRRGRRPGPGRPRLLAAAALGAARGTWRVQAYADPKAPAHRRDELPRRGLCARAARGRPEAAGSRRCARRARARSTLAARYLYGAPGADLDVSGDTSSSRRRAGIPGLDGYAVGLQDEPFENVAGEIEDRAHDGRAGPCRRDGRRFPTRRRAQPVEAKITLRVGETGGRAVERSVTLPIRPKGPVIGVKKLFGDLGEGAAASFDVVCVSPRAAHRRPTGLQWSLVAASTALPVVQPGRPLEF